MLPLAFTPLPEEQILMQDMQDEGVSYTDADK